MGIRIRKNHLVFQLSRRDTKIRKQQYYLQLDTAAIINAPIIEFEIRML